MILFNRSQIVVDEEGWVDDHLWKSGNIIVERLYNKRKNSFTFWFFGDGHLPDFWSYNNFHHFLMTGMIGGNFVNPTFTSKSGNIHAYNKTNESKVIVIDKNSCDETEIIINTYQYKSKAYRFSPHTGYWDHTSSGIRLVDNPFQRGSQKLGISPINENQNPSKISDTNTVLISKSVEDEIINQIREKKLYDFNRYATSESETTLAWISLTSLFENNELLSRCIQKSVSWIEGIIESDFTNTIFIGIDFWGSIFASQASILKDTKNYCVATKAKSLHNSLPERPEFLKNKILPDMNSTKNIVFFTDVVSTGHTLVNIKKNGTLTIFVGNFENARNRILSSAPFAA